MSVAGYTVWFSSAAACGCGGPQSEAKTYIGSMNRAQQAYHLETNRFSSNIKLLGIGIKAETKHYSYIVSRAAKDMVISISVPKQPTIKSYVGIAWMPQNVNAKMKEADIIPMAVLCEAEKPGMTGAPTPLPVEEKRDFWSNFLSFFTRSTQKQQIAVDPEAPSFEQATSISPVRDRNGMLKKIPCPQGFKALNY